MALNDYIPHPLNMSVSKVVKALDGVAPQPGTASPEPNAAQAAYEAKIDAMNAQNPYYKPGDAVPRAKGGKVKAGGAKMKNVDNSGMTKMKMGKK